MPTDNERRVVARRLRDIRPCKSGHIEWWKIAKALGLKKPAGRFGWEKFEPDSANRLADLIEPTDGFDLDHMAQVCFECLEGCDEPEYTLYETILTAISRYKRGESGLPSAALVDRDALLALAGEMDGHARDVSAGRNYVDSRDLMGYASRIREALGVEDA